MAIKTDESENSVDSDSSSSSSSAIKTAIASTAGAAVIGTIASNIEKDEKLPSTDEVVVAKTPDVIVAVDAVVTDIEEATTQVQTEVGEEIKIEESVADIELPKMDAQDKISEIVDAKVDTEFEIVDAKIDTELDKVIEAGAEVSSPETSNSEDSIPPTRNDKGFDDISNIISGRATILPTTDIDREDVSDLDVAGENKIDADASVNSSNKSDNDALSLSDMAKTTAVAVGAGVVAKAGVDVLAAQTEKDDVQQETLPDITNSKSAVDLVAHKASETMSDTEEKLETAFTEKLDKLINDEVALNLIEDKETVTKEISIDTDINIEQTDLVDEKSRDADASVDLSNKNDNDALSLSDMAKTVAVAVGAGVVAKAGAEILDSKKSISEEVDTSEQTSGATTATTKVNQKLTDTEGNSLGTGFRRRNMRRFRSTRR